MMKITIKTVFWPRRALFSSILGVLLAASSHAQNLVVNGSFETPAVTNKTNVAYPDAATMYPWQTTGTNFEIWTNGWTNGHGIGPLYSADGGQNLEILSTTNEATVWQTVPTVPETTYVLSFFHTPRPGMESVLTVSVNSNIVAIFYEGGKGMTNFDWQQCAAAFVATNSATTLAFSDLSLDYGASGTHIDGVTLEPNLVVNGSFETPAVTNKTRADFPDPDALYPWQTTATNFEIWTNGWSNGNGIGPLYSADGGQNLEILSTTNQATVWQTVPTVAGTSYSFGFYHTPRPGAKSTLTVFVNSNVVMTASEDGSKLTAFDWQWFGTNFIAATNSTTLSFNDTSSGGSGTHIDGVVLEGQTGVFASNTQAVLRPLLQSPPLMLSSQILPNSHIQFYWPAVPNQTYQVQYTDSLASNNWTNLGAPIVSKGTVLYMEDAPPAGTTQRFYRIVTSP